MLRAHIVLPRSFIAALLWPSPCRHVLEINELLSGLPAWRRARANTADLKGCVMMLTSFHRFSSAAHMANEHARYSWSDSLIHSSRCLSFPSCLSHFLSLSFRLAVRLSLSLCPLFKALLSSYHSPSIAL